MRPFSDLEWEELLRLTQKATFSLDDKSYARCIQAIQNDPEAIKYRRENGYVEVRIAEVKVLKTHEVSLGGSSPAASNVAFIVRGTGDNRMAILSSPTDTGAWAPITNTSLTAAQVTAVPRKLAGIEQVSNEV